MACNMLKTLTCEPLISLDTEQWILFLFFLKKKKEKTLVHYDLILLYGEQKQFLRDNGLSTHLISIKTLSLTLFSQCCTLVALPVLLIVNIFTSLTSPMRHYVKDFSPDHDNCNIPLPSY